MSDAEVRRLPIDVSAFAASPPPAPAPADTPAPAAPAAAPRAPRPQRDRPAGEERTKTARPRKTATAAAKAAKVPAAVKVAASTRKLLQDAAKPPVNQTAVILRALSATRTELAAHFRPPAVTGDDWETPAATQQVVHDEAWVQVTIRVTPGDLDKIDAMWREINAPNRSAMIDVALRLHLTPKRPAR